MWPCEFVSISAYNLIYFCLYFSGKPQVTRVYSRNAILHHSDAWERVPINPPRSPGNLISVPVLVMQFLMQSLEKTSPVRLVEWGEREREGPVQWSLAYTNLVACFAAGDPSRLGRLRAAGHCWTIGPLKDPVKVEWRRLWRLAMWRYWGRHTDTDITTAAPLKYVWDHWEACRQHVKPL